VPEQAPEFVKYTLGKIIGGGLPAAAYGGRRDVMSNIAPLGPVYQAGTLSGNPLAVAAANTTLELLADSDCYSRLEQISAMLTDGLEKAAADAAVPMALGYC
jgi:glutamate-1-semialdehyde 2,1-aminomutase